MICKFCGAQYEDKEVKCPFCGVMNEPEAKKAFEEKLNQVTYTVDQLSNQPKRVLFKNSLKLIILVFLLISVAIGAVFFIQAQKEKKEREKEAVYEKEMSALIDWENATFLQLDEWYENQEYDKLVEFQRELYLSDSEFMFYRWRHYSFVMVYEYYYDCKKGFKELSEDNEVELGSAIYGAMKLVYECTKEELDNYIPDDIENSTWGLTLKELELIEQYRSYASEFLSEKMGLSETELDAFYEVCESTGYVEACYDLAETYFE